MKTQINTSPNTLREQVLLITILKRYPKAQFVFTHQQKRILVIGNPYHGLRELITTNITTPKVYHSFSQDGQSKRRQRRKNK